ncbi:cupin domain-containing protein [Candidatus Woesearchaeota archaeon]|nr:cupin domain-containing protein [Candidatus Woesearchaeota archaeon]
MNKITLSEKISELNEKPWSPVDIARVNDQIIRLAYFKGEYHWHKHDNEDELFFVYKGSIVIQIKDKQDIVLNQGEIAVIEKGTEHCPKSDEGAYVLMFEPCELNSRGD